MTEVKSRFKSYSLHTNGFCDHIFDRDLFAAESFDIIASRQLTNGQARETPVTSQEVVTSLEKKSFL